MNDRQIREILQGFLPGCTGPFLSKDGRGMVLARGRARGRLIEIYRRQGYLIGARAGLRKAS